MPRLPFPKSTLDANQVLQFAFDEESGKLRTDASFSGGLTINLDPSTDGMYIGDPDTGNTLEVNPDGSINTNVAIDHVNDSVRLGNGTDFITSTTVGPAKTLDVTVKELPATVASEATLVAIENLLTTLNSLETTSNSLLTSIDAQVLNAATEATLAAIEGLVTILNSLQTTANSLLTSIDTKVLTDAQLRASPISISASALPLPTGAATAANQSTANASLASIDSKLTSPLAVSGSLTLADEPIKMSGTEDGLPGGTEFTFVNNRRNQILAAKDREQELTYADFGTKNQRITQIDYTATSIGTGVGYTARKTLTYTLVGNNYRRDSINWTLI